MHRIGMMSIMVRIWKKMQVGRSANSNGVGHISSEMLDAVDDMNILIKQFRGKLVNYMGLLEDRLREEKFLAGPDLTAADIMTVFSLTTMRGYCQYSLAENPSILRYLGDISKRPAYRAAIEKADPDLQPLIEADVGLFDFAMLKDS